MPRAPGRPLAALALAAIVLALSGCSRCGARPKGPAPERHLPASAALAVVLPSLEAAAAEVKALYDTVASTAAAGDLAEASSAVRGQLGFDPLDPKGLAAAGIDPGRGAGAASLANGTIILALPVLDRARFDALVLRLARERMGASQRAEAARGGRSVIVFRSDAGAPAALSYTVLGDLALLAAGPGGLDAVAAAASLAPDASLERSAAWVAGRAALGQAPTIVAFAPPGSPALAGIAMARDGAALGVQAGARRLTARVALLLPEDRMSFWKGVAGASPPRGPGAGTPEIEALDPAAALVARFGGSFSAAAPWLAPRLAPLAARLAAIGVDLRHDVLDALAPGAALSVSLAPEFELAAVSRGPLDHGLLDVFRMLHVAFLGHVRDPAQARAVLGRIGRAAPRGARIASRSLPSGGTELRATFRGTEIGVALLGDRVAFGGGAGTLDALERRIMSGQRGYAAPTPASRAALESGIAAAMLDVGHLVASVRALPEAAYGTGPNGFVMRSLVDRLLEPAAHLRAATVRLDLGPGAALVDLEVEGEPETGRP